MALPACLTDSVLDMGILSTVEEYANVTRSNLMYKVMADGLTFRVESLPVIQANRINEYMTVHPTMANIGSQRDITIQAHCRGLSTEITTIEQFEAAFEYYKKHWCSWEKIHDETEGVQSTASFFCCETQAEMRKLGAIPFPNELRPWFLEHAFYYPDSQVEIVGYLETNRQNPHEMDLRRFDAQTTDITMQERLAATDDMLAGRITVEQYNAILWPNPPEVPALDWTYSQSRLTLRVQNENGTNTFEW